MDTLFVYRVRQERPGLWQVLIVYSGGSSRVLHRSRTIARLRRLCDLYGITTSEIIAELVRGGV